MTVLVMVRVEVTRATVNVDALNVSKCVCSEEKHLVTATYIGINS